MNVLIPGGAGYVGAVLVPHLRDAGHRVTVYDLPDGDVRDADAFRRACDGQDAVIYLASISNNDQCVREPELAESVNIKAMFHVPEIARDAGVKRFIYASSVAGYGVGRPDGNGGYLPSKETQGLCTPTPYALGKLCGEGALSGHTNYVVVRSASVCGWSPKMRYDLTVNKMVHDALMNGRIVVNGGEQKRSHIHILDLCDFYRLLLDVGMERIAMQRFNVVAENQSVMETAECVIRTLSGQRRRARNMVAFIEASEATDNRSYTVDGAKAREMLGFSPRRTIADAVREIQARMELSHAA